VAVGGLVCSVAVQIWPHTNDPKISLSDKQTGINFGCSLKLVPGNTNDKLQTTILPLSATLKCHRIILQLNQGSPGTTSILFIPVQTFDALHFLKTIT